MRAQLREIVTAAGWQMIYAADEAEFDALWTDMKAQLPDFGYDEVLAYDMEIVNDMIEARQRVLRRRGVTAQKANKDREREARQPSPPI